MAPRPLRKAADKSDPAPPLVVLLGAPSLLLLLISSPARDFADIVDVMAAEKTAADALKDEGNVLFGQAQYKAAIEKYTQAIALNDKNEIYWCNRAFANLKCENFGIAITDAAKSIELNPRHVKAYFHRATANMILGHLDLALKDFQAVRIVNISNAIHSLPFLVF